MTEAEKLRAWFMGNAPAVALFASLAEVSQIADDLVDRDQDHDLEDRRRLAVRLLHLALITIPANEFFSQYRGWFAPLLSDAVLAWDFATGAEQSGNESARAFGYVYRDQIERAIVQAALLIGGVEHARQVQESVFVFFRFEHPDGETFADYCKREKS